MSSIAFTVLGEEVTLSKEQMKDFTCQDIFEIAEQRGREAEVMRYLKKKYAGYEMGIPTEFVQEELLLSDEQYVGFMRLHYGRRTPEYIHFEIVSDYLSYKVAEQC